MTRVAIWSVDTHGEKRPNIFSLGAPITRIVSKLIVGVKTGGSRVGGPELGV